MYAEAFFMGVKSVEIIKGGDVIPGQRPNKPNPVRAPNNFLEEKVEYREGWGGDYQYRTCG